MSFRWQRPVVKELAALYVWLVGIVLVLFFKYPEFTHNDAQLRNQALMVWLPSLTAVYLAVRYLIKSGKLQGL
jgi:peptidoglycan biosynthesis protein MviN/MurJ (putative lipid II flippase)